MRTLSALLLAALAFAQPDDAGIMQRYEKRNAERRRLWQEKQFRKAASLLEELRRDPEMMSVETIKVDVLYNLACAYALAAEGAKAIDALRQAETAGLARVSSYTHVSRDADFDSIRETPEFKAVLARIKEQSRPPRLQWNSSGARTLRHAPDQPELVELRRTYRLDDVIAGAADEYEKLRRIVKWAHAQWKHSGNNEPSQPDPLTILREAGQGKQFRCVEYGTIIAAAATALGMPARRLQLKTRDVETRLSGAGHVVAEVWLKQSGKWVFADGQFDVVPERDGVPLNAVEFQDAIAAGAPGLACRSSSNADQEAYIDWIAPYLFYFDVNIDQRWYGAFERNSRCVMLVPAGAKNPAVFQRRFPIGNCTYISEPDLFYPAP